MADICRLCLFQMRTPTFSASEVDIQNRTQMKFVIPEIDLDMTTGLAFCNLCSSLLSAAYHFKLKCLATERKLKQYIDDGRLSVPIDLKVYKESIESSSTDIKIEVTEESEDGAELSGVETKFNVDIVCDKCNITFHDNENYDAHIMECFSCENNESDEGLAIEEDLHLAHKCQHCNNFFTTESDLNVHISKLHSLLAPVNADTVYNKPDLNDKGETFTCSICDQCFSHKSRLVLHMELHSGDIWPIKCKTCGITCKSNGVLNQHMRTHTGYRPYRCEICGRAFAQKATLTRHKRVLHETTRPYTCEHCEKTFKIKNSLTKHMKTHRHEDAEKTICCQFENCDKKFYTERECRVHMIRHGEKNVLCTICDMAFVNTNGLTRHMRRHTGEKPYKCDICGKKFAAQSDYRRHTRSHRPKIENIII